MEEMFNNYNDAAKKEVKYGLSKTLLLAILAGAFIALAAAVLVCGIIHSGLGIVHSQYRISFMPCIGFHQIQFSGSAF